MRCSGGAAGQGGDVGTEKARTGTSHLVLSFLLCKVKGENLKFIFSGVILCLILRRHL